MAQNPRFQVRDTEEELKKLDEAISRLGYKDRADWYREMKRKTIEKAREVSKDMEREKIIKSLMDHSIKDDS